MLARAGVPVTVLEAHVYAGGCAGTFYHRGYRFDAGATLAGGFAAGAPMHRLAEALDLTWPARPVEPAEPAMVVHLPDGTRVARPPDPEGWRAARRAAFGAEAEPFWRWQERAADVLWDLALDLPPWPPQRPADLPGLLRTGLRHPGLARFALDAVRPVRAHLPGATAHPADRLRLFVDAQLLIASQATSERTNALFGAAALDLPRRGLVHLSGGMGALAGTLVEAIRRAGGEVRFRQEVTRIAGRGAGLVVETKRGATFAAGAVVLNLPPSSVVRLLGEDAPPTLRRRRAWPADGWGAFTVYAGVDGTAIPANCPLHHQVVLGRPLAEGNSVFVSLSPAWDTSRAPPGRRALTLSTHTRIEPWWTLFERDRAAYRARADSYTAALLAAAERALPGLRPAARLILRGTPVTFQRFTRRAWGWVGGYPQTGLWRTRDPRLGPRLWLAGDSIFPGQSTAATALGGLRVARSVLDWLA
jgi:C-3',4' desaturase CrtD